MKANMRIVLSALPLAALTACGSTAGPDVIYNAPDSSSSAESSTGTLHTASMTLGTILVNGAGMSVSFYDSDKANETASACTGPCSSLWPAVAMTVTAPAIPGVPGTVGTIIGVDDANGATVTSHGAVLRSVAAALSRMSTRAMSPTGAPTAAVADTSRPGPVVQLATVTARPRGDVPAKVSGTPDEAMPTANGGGAVPASRAVAMAAVVPAKAMAAAASTNRRRRRATLAASLRGGAQIHRVRPRTGSRARRRRPLGMGAEKFIASSPLSLPMPAGAKGWLTLLDSRGAKFSRGEVGCADDVQEFHFVGAFGPRRGGKNEKGLHLVRVKDHLAVKGELADFRVYESLLFRVSDADLVLIPQHRKFSTPLLEPMHELRCS